MHAGTEATASFLKGVSCGATRAAEGFMAVLIIVKASGRKVAGDSRREQVRNWEKSAHAM